MKRASAAQSRRDPELVATWCAAFRERCRAQGIRVTPQRLAVYMALAMDTTHPTADDVHGRLRPELPSLSLATVYRILESFEREGMIRRISTPDGAGRFDANLRPHQHLICRICRAVSDFETPALGRVGIPTTIPDDFAAEEIEIRISGLCRSCHKTVSRKTPN